MNHIKHYALESHIRLDLQRTVPKMLNDLHFPAVAQQISCI